MPLLLETSARRRRLPRTASKRELPRRISNARFRDLRSRAFLFFWGAFLDRIDRIDRILGFTGFRWQRCRERGTSAGSRRALDRKAGRRYA
jgi:hypothetical protein